MPTEHQPNPSLNGTVRRNLFVEADPDRDAFGSPRSHRRARASTRSTLRPGRGLVVPVAPSSAATVGRSDAARFTRPNGTINRLGVIVGRRLRRADVRAGGVLRRLAARRYAPLVALALLAAVLIAVSCLALALRDASAARHAAERDRLSAVAALRRERARIDGLSSQLDEADLTARHRERASAAAAPGWRIRAQPAERELTLPRPRRR
jgi:hypothetical protein